MAKGSLTPSTVTDSEQILYRFLQELPSDDCILLNDSRLSFSTFPWGVFSQQWADELAKEDCHCLKLLAHANDWNRIALRLQATIYNDPNTSVLFRLDPAFGNGIWLWLQVTGTFDENRCLTSLHGTLTDVSARKAAVNDLRTKEQFYEHILSTMPVQLAVFNEEHRYIYCNKTAIQNDHIREWIIGKDDFEYCRFRGKDINIAWRRRYFFQQALAYRDEIKWEEEIWKDDTNKTVSLRRLTPIYDDDGNLQFVLGYGFDITNRRLAEERAAENEKLLASINANIQDGIYRYSPARGFLYVNDAFLRIFGYQSQAELNAQGKAFFRKDEEGRQVLIDIQGVQGSFNNREVLLHGEEEKARFWGLVSCSKRSDPKEGIIYDGIITDITEFKESEQLLRKTNKALRQKNNELDRFIYSASHDLRAPLTSIQGVLQLAELDEPSADMQYYLGLIGSSVNKLENFVNDLIDYYRNAKTQQSYHQIDFEDLVRSTFESFQYMEGAERITLCPENWLSSDFYSDHYRLRIVLSNLLSNAIKYQDPEKEAPYVKVHLSDKGDCHQLLVADNGLGIPSDKVDDVWELFYQSGHDQQGSGMGLFIVKETVQKLGGSVEIRAQAGQGTTFEIKLPKNGSERQNYPADR